MISLRKIFRLYEYIQPHIKYSLPLEDRLPGEEILVLAPHPDDEAIGCAGTIYKHTKNSKKKLSILPILMKSVGKKVKRPQKYSIFQILNS